MSSDRLTRTELSWLLTQEAKSAAQKLRKGVRVTIPPPETGVGDGIDDTGLETTLNRLDETMSMLASLHGTAQRARRGKIDVAALIWEVAPEARVQIDMGTKGLVVFGDESELKRMLHVLMTQGGDPGLVSSAEVSVKREDDDIKIGVVLGPDKSQGSEAENQWLARMATRFGGRLELEGDKQTLVLLASDDQRELETLRRELAAAQAQGEAFARELAAVRSKSDVPPSALPGSHGPGAEGLSAMVAMARAVVSDMRGILASIGRDMAPLRGPGQKPEVADAAASVSRHITAASEVIADLARLSSCPQHELPSICHVGEILRDVVKSEASRAARHEVTVEVDVSKDVTDALLPAQAFGVLIHQLVDAAISNSPTGSTVKVTAVDHATGLAILFDDAGKPISPKAKHAAGQRDFELLIQERPQSLPLIGAFSIAAFLRAPISIEDHENGARVRVVFPKTTG